MFRNLQTPVQSKPILNLAHDAGGNGGQVSLQTFIDDAENFHPLEHPGWPALHHAVLRGDFAGVQGLLQPGVHVNSIVPGVMTPLMLAARLGFKDIALLLVRGGAHVDAVDDSGRTAMVIAAENGHIGVVQALQQQGADVGRALLLAAKMGIVIAVDIFLKVGADPNATNGAGETALMLAAKVGSTDMARILLQAGAAPQVALANGTTALIVAAAQGHAGMVELLLQSKAVMLNAVDTDGWSALMFAATIGNAGIVNMLMQAGADPHVVAANGLSALTLAQAYRHAAAESVLTQAVEQGKSADLHSRPAAAPAANYATDVDRPNAEPAAVTMEDASAVAVVTRSGLPPPYQAPEEAVSGEAEGSAGAAASPSLTDGDLQMESACSLSHQSLRQNPVTSRVHVLAKLGMDKELKSLLKKGVDANVVDAEKGWTALFYAVENGELAAVQVLLDHGANPNIVDPIGNTAIFYAIQRGSFEMVFELLDCGARVNYFNAEGWTPVTLAAAHGHTGIVVLLAHEKADLNAANLDGMTPLMLSVNNLHAITEMVLLLYGADVNATSLTGASAMTMTAVKEGQAGAANLSMRAEVQGQSVGTAATGVAAGSWAAKLGGLDEAASAAAPMHHAASTLATSVFSGRAYLAQLSSPSPMGEEANFAQSGLIFPGGDLGLSSSADTSEIAMLDSSVDAGDVTGVPLPSGSTPYGVDQGTELQHSYPTFSLNLIEPFG